MRRPSGRWVLVALALWTGCEIRKPEESPPPPPPPAIPLPEAIETGNLDALERLHEQGQDWSWPDQQGRTPLTLAARAGQGPVIDWLLNQGADPRIADDDGMTPLHIAAQNGNLDLVLQLIGTDLDLDAVNAQGQTPALLADLGGHQAIVEWLVSAGSAFALPDLDLVDDEEEDFDDTPPPPIRIEGDFRMWTSASGQALEAEFVELTLDTVVLRSPEDRLFRISLNNLSRDSQILARQLSTAELPSVGRTRSGGSSREGRSLALRIGRQKGWDVLEDARWLKNASNDGDSFHVRHDGNHYIFRLYYVDAAETSLAFPQRVHDQAKYFGTTVNETLKLGKDAARLSEQHLAKRPFTVVTRWEDARGSSSLPRHYAFIIVDDGDLDELLTEAGLVRIFGMPIDGNLGKLKRRDLVRLEQQARADRAGAWKRSADTAANP